MAAATKSIVPPARKPSGDRRPDPDTPTGHAPTLVKRIVDDAVRLGADRRMGTVLGRLHLEGLLTASEFEAGLRYAEDVGAYERIKGHPARHSQSPSFEFGRKGASGVDLDALERMDPEAAARLRNRIERKHRKIQKRYDRAQACIPILPIIAASIIESVCCDDRPVHSLHHPALKAMLGHLARDCYNLTIPAREPPPPKIKHPVRKAARDLAEAACDAIEQKFADARATAQTYEITAGREKARFKSRRIIVTGLCEDGTTPFRQAIDVPLRIIMPKVLDAQIAKVAEKMGWKRAE
jgi:hypothetical protein